MDVFLTLLKVAAIFVLLLVTLKFVGRFAGPGRVKVGRHGAAPPVEVVARTSVGRHASVVAVRIGSRAYALGVTDQQVNVISEIDSLAAVEDEPIEHESILQSPAARTQSGSPVPSWKDFVENLRERTVRR